MWVHAARVFPTIREDSKKMEYRFGVIYAGVPYGHIPSFWVLLQRPSVGVTVIRITIHNVLGSILLPPPHVFEWKPLHGEGARNLLPCKRHSLNSMFCKFLPLGPCSNDEGSAWETAEGTVKEPCHQETSLPTGSDEARAGFG